MPGRNRSGSASARAAYSGSSIGGTDHDRVERLPLVERVEQTGPQVDGSDLHREAGASSMTRRGSTAATRVVLVDARSSVAGAGMTEVAVTARVARCPWKAST